MYKGKISEGLRRYKIGTCPFLKCGFMDTNDNVIISPIYTNVRDFHEGLAAVKIGNWSTAKWGFINTAGELIIDYIFDKPRPFSDGYAKVIINNEWCFINRIGTKVISLKDYDGGSNFHNGFAIVSKKISLKEEIFGIINKKGVEIVPCTINCQKLGLYFSCDNLVKHSKMHEEGFYTEPYSIESTNM